MKLVVDDRTIDEALDEVLSDIMQISTDYELAPGAVLIELGLTCLRSVAGEVITKEEAMKYTADFWEAVKIARGYA